ncbi:hypothetical protein ES705_40234 [subsurface metagenome]
MVKIKYVYWTLKARDDINHIAEYISQDSESTARTFTENLIDSIKRLKDFPLSGRIVPEYNNTPIREIIFKKYRLIYRIKDNVVQILNVFHGSKPLD